MDGDLSSPRSLKRRWDEEDAVREERERGAKELFLEQQANEIFAPIERCLIRLDNVLRNFGGSVEINSTWEHVADQRLRRVAKVRSTQADQNLTLDFNVHGLRILHRDKSYQLSRDMEALIRAILGEVEQFFTTFRQQVQTSRHSRTEASSLAFVGATNIGAANG